MLRGESFERTFKGNIFINLGRCSWTLGGIFRRTWERIPEDVLEGISKKNLDGISDRILGCSFESSCGETAEQIYEYITHIVFGNIPQTIRKWTPSKRSLFGKYSF